MYLHYLKILNTGTWRAFFFLCEIFLTILAIIKQRIKIKLTKNA
jgi:hypothetical protein